MFSTFNLWFDPPSVRFGSAGVNTVATLGMVKNNRDPLEEVVSAERFVYGVNMIRTSCMLQV